MWLSGTREIGIRLALGAPRAEVIRMVASGSLPAVSPARRLVSPSQCGTRLLRALLFGVEPRDPVILVAVTGVLLSAAIAAALLAARRATRVSPLVAMQSD